MAVGDFVPPAWLHYPLSAIGFFALVGTVIAAVIAVSALAYVLLGLLLGVPVAVVLAELSISQIAAERTDDPFSWIAGFLFGVVLLPYVVGYHRRLGRALRDHTDDDSSAGEAVRSRDPHD